MGMRQQVRTYTLGRRATLRGSYFEVYFEVYIKRRRDSVSSLLTMRAECHV